MPNKTQKLDMFYTKFSLKTIFWIISSIALILMIVMSLNSGSSGDEYVNYKHAGYVYDYYATAGADTSAINTPKTHLQYYGQSFDNTTYVINKWLNIKNYYDSRHILNSISGWLLILFTGLTAALIFGWGTGIIAFLFMFFSPLILGHSWNNPKDIPYAFTYTLAIFFLIKFLKELPSKKIWTIIFLTISIALSISIRIGGLIIIPYIFLFTALYFLLKKEFYCKNGFISAIKIIPILLIIAIGGYFLGLIFWPYAIENPIKNPIESLSKMTHFAVGLNQLFEGEIVMSKNIPWYYGIKYLFIKSPIIIILGSILFFTTVAFRKELKKDYLYYSLLFFSFIFPIAYTIYEGSNLYGGCRHLLWVISPIVVLAAGGFSYFLDKKNKYIKYGAIAVITLLLIHPAKHIIKNHPYEYTYYNQFVGGVKGAYGNYEMDYYYHSLREGAEWLIKNKVNKKDTITVVTNHSPSVEYYFRKYPQVKVRYCRYYEKSKADWDYAIWANEHITPLQLKKGYWPPKEAIHTMDVDGKPIGAVVKRISHEDYKGFSAIKKRKTQKARQHFNNFLKLYPESEEVLGGYAQSFLMERNYDSTIVYADKSLKYNPRSMGAYFFKASAYNAEKKYTEALKTTDEMLKIKNDFAEAHYQKAFALKYMNKPNDALKEFQEAIRFKKDYYPAYYQVGEILTNYRQLKKAISVYSKILQKKKNDFTATILTARCYYFLGDKTKAQQLLNSIPKNKQNRIAPVMLKCRMAIDSKDMQTASQYLTMTRNINNNANLFILRAKFVLHQKNKEQAVKYLERATKLDPVNNEAKGMLKALQKEGKTANRNNSQEQKTNKQKPKTQQSIMYQKEKKKKTNAVINPFK